MPEKEENALEKQLQELNFALRKNRIIDLVELIGNTKQILFRNLWAGIAKGIGIGIRFYHYNSYYCYYFAENCDSKYSCNRGIYSRYCRHCRKSKIKDVIFNKNCKKILTNKKNGVII